VNHIPGKIDRPATMSSTFNPSPQVPLKPIRRERDPRRTARTVKVQEPELPAQETIGTGRDGKEKVAKVLQLSSFEVSTAVRPQLDTWQKG
jgi:hypothetical protein